MEALAPIEDVPVQQFPPCTTAEAPVLQPQTASNQQIQATISTVGKILFLISFLSFMICTGILVKMISFSPPTKIDQGTNQKASYFS